MVDDGPSLQKSVRLQIKLIENLSPRSTIDYALVFVDIERMVDKKESVAIWNDLIKDSKIFNDLKPGEVPFAVCADCEGGGGGGGGGGTQPKPWLILKYIKLKYAGDDECEIYIREDTGFNIPGAVVKGCTGHRLSGDVRYDAAGRSRWYPNLNNAGDEGATDIALWQLSDTYPVSFVGIEDDDDEGQHDCAGCGDPIVSMFWEYRRDVGGYYSNTNRQFDVVDGIHFWADSDDIWRTSHFANFTASNMVEDQLMTLELNDFKVIVTKETF